MFVDYWCERCGRVQSAKAAHECEPEVIRVDGSMSCLACNKPYHDHPQHELGPTFYVTCDGWLAKT